MPRSDRFYLAYVDDSGNETVGTIWTALAIPAEYWTIYLARWLEFRHWLYSQHGIPASFELHAQVWLKAKPTKQLSPDELEAVRVDGSVPDILMRGRAQRKLRFQVFEKALKTIGTFSEARIFTVFAADADGPTKIGLYDELLCFLEEFLLQERGHATLIVDGAMDSGGHLRTAHRALDIKRRHVVEDAAQRRSAHSQLLQMADLCAHAAFQSVQQSPGLDEKFTRQYETALSKVLARPFGVDEGRCIRGLDYHQPVEDCPSERVVVGA